MSSLRDKPFNLGGFFSHETKVFLGMKHQKFFFIFYQNFLLKTAVRLFIFVNLSGKNIFSKIWQQKKIDNPLPPTLSVK